MARLRFYHDKRRPQSDGKCPLTVSISHCGTSALIPTSVFVKPEYWHPGSKETEPHIKKSCPGSRVLNGTLAARYGHIEAELMKLIEDGSIHSFSNATALKKHITDELDGTDKNDFLSYFQVFVDRIDIQSTSECYKYTLNKIREFSQGKRVRFEDVNKKWLDAFEKSMNNLAVNTRGIHLRNIRAVFNAGLDDEITNAPYPFRKFKIKKKETIKRSISAGELKKLYEFECEPHQRIYVDMFILIFLLRGINIKDLSHLKESDIVNGRIEYYRFKTGRHYSVLIEPEAWEIINRYRGKSYLLCIMDKCTDYRHFRKQMNENLRAVGPTKILRYWKKEREPFFPAISSYWTRHSWATIASKLDIPKETIQAGLGHGQKTITDIYIDFDMNKVDVANRKIIDATFYPGGTSKAG